MSSRLSLLMKMFSITGKDLAELMNIDSSLVSKWRSGKRALKPKSVYADKIVNFIMEHDKPFHHENVYKLLANDYENIKSYTEKETALFLKTWLTDGNTGDQNDVIFDGLKKIETAEMCVFYKFHGKKGRRQAVKFLTDYTFENAPGLERLSYTDENAEWFYEDEEFFKEWKEKNIQSLQNGNLIKAIHPIDRTYKNTASSIFSWMPLHITGKTSASYIARYSDEPMNITLFLVPGHFVVFSLSSKAYEKCPDTYLTNDKTFLMEFEAIFHDFYNRSLPIFNAYHFNSNEDFFNDLIGILEARHKKYLYCPTFLFMPLSENLIREILVYNQISEEDISKYQELYHIISTLNLRSISRYLINREKIKAHLKKETVILDSFSFMTGRMITVPQDIFVKIMFEALESIRGVDYIEIGFTDSRMLQDMGNINVLAEEKTYANFFSTDVQEPLSLMTKEATVVTSIFRRLEKTWDAIPRLNRNKGFVYNQLLELLEALQSEESQSF